MATKTVVPEAPDATDHGAEEFTQADQLGELLQDVDPGSGDSDADPLNAVDGGKPDGESANAATQTLLGELESGNRGHEKPPTPEAPVEAPAPTEQKPLKPVTPPVEVVEDGDDEEPSAVIERQRHLLFTQANELARYRMGQPQQQPPAQTTQPAQQPTQPGPSTGQQTQTQVPTQPAGQSRVDAPPPAPVTPLNVVTAERLAKITSDPTEFNKVLAEAGAVAQENFIRVAAQLIPQIIQRQMVYHEAVNEFYRENEDLKPLKDYVQMKVMEYQSANPQENSLSKIFTEAGNLTRKDLSIAARAKAAAGGTPAGNGQSRQSAGGGRPAFAGGNKGGRGTGGSGGGKTGNTQQDQINDLIT